MLFLKQRRTRSASGHLVAGAAAKGVVDEDDCCSVGSLQSVQTKSSRWLPRRILQRRRSSLSAISANDESSFEHEDNTCDKDLLYPSEESALCLPECSFDRCCNNSKNNSNCDGTGSTAEDSGSALTVDESSSPATGVRFNLSRTQFRDDTARNMNCAMEHYDCWYNRMSITDFKMEQKQVTEEVFEVEQANTQAWRKTLEAAYEEHQTLEEPQETCSAALLEQLYTDEDAAELLVGLEFNSLARMRCRPHVRSRAILQLLKLAENHESAAQQIAALSRPTRRFAQSVAAAQAKALLLQNKNSKC